MTHKEAQAVRLRFESAWNALRAAPLSAPDHERARQGSCIRVVTFFDNRLRVWTEHTDDTRALGDDLARRVLELRGLFPIDMKLRAIAFVETDLLLFEVAVIEPSGPAKPHIPARPIVTDPPRRMRRALTLAN